MKKVLFYGDSNTYGYDPSGFMGGRYSQRDRWTTILQENCKETWEIMSDGMPGRALPATRYEWEYLRSLFRQAAPLDLFAVMLGTNDILGTVRPDAAKAARKMNDFITFFMDNAGEGTQFLLIAPPRFELTELSWAEPYVSGDKSLAQIFYDESRKLAEYYEEIAEDRQTLFVDASKWELDFAFDGVHLSERGHALFAAEMTEVFRTI